MFIKVGAEWVACVALPFRERRLEVGETSLVTDSWPFSFGWGTKETGNLSVTYSSFTGEDDLPEDLEDLIDFRVTREQWLSGAHFRKDAAYRPHIHTG